MLGGCRGCPIVAQIQRCSLHTSLGSSVPVAGFARERFPTTSSTRVPVPTQNRAEGGSTYRVTVPRCLLLGMELTLC